MVEITLETRSFINRVLNQNLSDEELEFLDGIIRREGLGSLCAIEREPLNVPILRMANVIRVQRARQAQTEQLMKNLTEDVSNANKKWSDADRMLDAAASIMSGVRNKLETVKAILHLMRVDQSALSNNSMPRVHQTLTEAFADLERGEIKLDRIPF